MLEQNCYLSHLILHHVARLQKVQTLITNPMIHACVCLKLSDLFRHLLTDLSPISCLERDPILTFTLIHKCWESIPVKISPNLNLYSVTAAWEPYLIAETGNP